MKGVSIVVAGSETLRDCSVEKSPTDELAFLGLELGLRKTEYEPHSRVIVSAHIFIKTRRV